MHRPSATAVSTAQRNSPRESDAKTAWQSWLGLLGLLIAMPFVFLGGFAGSWLTFALIVCAAVLLLASAAVARDSAG